MKLTSILPSLIFPICLILAISTLFSPGAFKRLSEFSLEKIGTLQSIQEMDDDLDKLNPVDEIMEKSKGITSGVIDFFSGDKNKEKEDEIEGKQLEVDKAGILEEKLYPKLVFSLALVYRIGVFILGVVGLILSIYLGYVMEGVTENKKLEKRIKKLEDKLSSQKVENKKQFSSDTQQDYHRSS